MEWDICLDKSSDIPLYRQLSGALAGLMASGKLSPDAKLPPIRQMAQMLNLNNTTVVSAYKDLERKAAVYSVAGSGTYVSPPVRAQDLAVQAPVAIADEYINFAHMATEAAHFPVAAFKRAFNTVMDRDGGMAFGYHDSSGYEPLRERLCHLLSGVGVVAVPEYVHIISSAEQGICMLADTLLNSGDTVFVERSSPHGAVAAFKSARVKIIEIPMVKEGPDFNSVEALLRRHKPKLFYVTPNFRQPTGACYSAESMCRLLTLAHAHDAYIIEEDQLSDFYYDGKKRPPLKSLDSGGRVIYIKSFSRIMTQGFGMDLMVCPHTIPELKMNNSISPPGYTQRAFDTFLNCGDYDTHAANMRRIYARRYQRLTAAAHTYLAPLASFDLPGGGLSLWVTPHCEVRGYAEKFLQRKVVVTPEQLFGAEMLGFRLSFAAVPEELIAEGVGVIASVLRALSTLSRA